MTPLTQTPHILFPSGYRAGTHVRRTRSPRNNCSRWRVGRRQLWARLKVVAVRLSDFASIWTHYLSSRARSRATVPPTEDTSPGTKASCMLAVTMDTWPSDLAWQQDLLNSDRD